MTEATAETETRTNRIEAIDILRGLVMVLMALDHVRDYFHAAPPGLDPTDPAQSHALLYATRWITYLCAPTFVLLTGTSAWLRGAASGDKAALSRFLLTRGLWLILLELTLVGTGFTFHPLMLFLQVIWVIGAGLIVLAALCRHGPCSASVSPLSAVTTSSTLCVRPREGRRAGPTILTAASPSPRSGRSRACCSIPRSAGSASCSWVMEWGRSSACPPTARRES
jgi:uncharacterized membrane protein